MEKIQSTFDLDEERLQSIARTCSDRLTPFGIDLAFCGSNQRKLEFIHSKQKEVQEKIKEAGIKSHYAADLYNQHLNIELKKAFNNQAFNIPFSPNETSIFKVEKIKFIDSEEASNEVDHVECALNNAQKAGEEFIVWTIFYSELEDMEEEILERMGIFKSNELAETTFSVKESGEELKIEKRNQTGLPVNGTTVSSRHLQIFKKETSYDLFCYLQEEYTLDDQSPVAKYSYIYHFLAYEQFLTSRSQLKYMEFIKDHLGIQMSKILPANEKFNDDIHHLLSRIKSNFERKNKFEQKLN